MSEHPIIFSGPMVKAILDGRKTQTRRVVQAFPTSVSWAEWNTKDATLRRPCPYGGPGDALWVREAWGTSDPDLSHVCPSRLPSDTPLCYRASGEWLPGHTKRGLRWRQSIHMPRWASRLTLRVTGVRVERLQAITCADIHAEGIDCPVHDGPGLFCVSECAGLRRAWATGWDSINGKRAPWASNPWLFVVSFERVEVAP